MDTCDLGNIDVEFRVRKGRTKAFTLSRSFNGTGFMGEYPVVYLGIGGDLKFENKTSDKSSDYRSYYTPETKEIVAQVYKEDIALFDYTF